MAFDLCPVCAGPVSPEDTACRICGTPVSGSPASVPDATSQGSPTAAPAPWAVPGASLVTPLGPGKRAGYGPPAGHGPVSDSAPPLGYGPPGVWYGPPGYGPPVGYPPPPPTSKSTRTPLLVIGSLGAVLLFVIGAVVFLGRTRGPSYPDQWDPRAQYAVSFIEADKGSPFLHAVYIDFLSEEEFVKVVTTRTTDVTDEQRHAAAQQVGLLRSLGLVQGDVDLLKEEAALHGAGTAAYYDPPTKRVRVRGTELSMAVKETLVHELTHAWQDQHYDLSRMPKLATKQERDAFRTMAEGDAVNSERAWDKTLSDADRATLAEESKKAGDTATSGMKTVPEVLIASFSAPYQFGPAFMRGLAATGGRAEIDDAFAAPPQADRQIMQPWVYLQGEGQPLGVATPATPAAPVDTDSFGALFVYLMLAEHLDPHQALAVADSWGGDAYALTEEGGKVCVKARVDASSAAAAAVLNDGFGAWAHELAHVQLHPDATGVTIDACDPGAAADLHSSGRSLRTIEFPSARVSLWAQRLETGRPPTAATCYADAFVASLTLEDLADGALTEARVGDLRAAADQACP